MKIKPVLLCRWSESDTGTAVTTNKKGVDPTSSSTRLLPPETAFEFVDASTILAAAPHIRLLAPETAFEFVETSAEPVPPPAPEIRVQAGHRRRIKTKAKAKVVASVWGEEVIQFLAAQAILPRMIFENRMN